jgi:hypothetical protein
MKAIEHHSNPESFKPDQAKRMQTSLFHLMPGQSNRKDHHEEHIASHQDKWQKSDQFGSLTGRKTMDAIVKVIEDRERALDNKETIHAVFFDFSKAFDLVNHKRLMQKLKKLLPPYLTWIAEWLSDRKQRVKCGNTYFLWKLVVAGVIQGSMLGPILFLLYISDIKEYLPAGAYHPRYADDILAHSTFIDIIDDHTQQSIDGMAIWSKENHLRLNTNKTQHMVISKKQHQSTQQLTATLNDIDLKRVEIRVPRRSSQQQHELRPTMGGNCFKNKSNLPSQETQTHGFYGRQARVHLQKLDPEPVHLRAPLLASASTRAKKGNASTTTSLPKRHRNIQERALRVHNIKPMEDFLNNQCVNIVQRILKDPNHPITTSIHRNKYNNNIIVPRTNTTHYQNSVLQKSLRIIRDGYVNKYMNPRRIETTTAAYHVEIPAHSNNNNNNSNLRYPNPSINPVPALCIQSQKYQ